MKSRAQKYLEKLSAMDSRIEQLKYELSELEKNRVTIRAVNYEQHGSGSGKNEAAFEKTADKIADLELEINHKIEALTEYRHNAIRLIQRLEDSDQMKILFMHYIQRMTFDEIISSVGYGRTKIYKIHKTALAELDKTSEF